MSGAMQFAVVAAAVALVPVAASGDNDLLAARARYLPPAQQYFAPDADGWQARYDAGRDLEEAVRRVRVTPACAGLRAGLLRLARAQIAVAEHADYPVWRPRPRALPTVPTRCVPGRPEPSPATPQRPPLPTVAAPERARDEPLAARLAAIGTAYRGWAGFWVHDLRTGRTAGWNADAVFPAGSAVKLGALLASLSYPSLAYDAVQIGAWSSNLAANRIAEKLGVGTVSDTLRRLGMWSSTYSGLYRAGTSARRDAPRPPPVVHSRVTTAHDLGRALYRLQAAGAGNRLALVQLGVTQPQARTVLALLAASRAVGANAGLLRPWLPHVTLAQKNAWLSDLRTTAAVVYGTRPVIVVVEAYRPGIGAREALALARQVVRAAGL